MTLPTRRIAAGSKSTGIGRAFLSSLDDRGDRQVIAQRLATASVNVPDGGTDLGVAIAVDFLLQKVDEPPVALKDRKDAEIRACGNFREKRLDPAAKSRSVRRRQKARKARAIRFKSLSLSVVSGQLSAVTWRFRAEHTRPLTHSQRLSHNGSGQALSPRWANVA